MKMSVKEGIDALPDGICCFDVNSDIRMVNLIMEKLIEAGSDETDDIKEYIKLLKAGECKGFEYLQKGKRPVVKFENRIYRFEIGKIGIDNENLTELRAVDVTELYEALKQLSAERVLLEHMNDRLMALKPEIAEVKKERAELDRKLGATDEYAEVLAKTRACFEDGGDTKTVLDEWKALLERC